MSDFFESGIYIVIVAVAVLLTLTVVLLMSASAKPQKTKKQLGRLPAGRQKGTSAEPMLLTEAGAKEDKRGKKPKKEKRGKKEKQEKESKEEKIAAQKPDKQLSAAAAAGEEVEVPAVENVTAAELPSVDTLDDSDDGAGEDPAAKEDLMSLFTVEEAEDTYVSELANKLFDVETSNIQALGLEVLSILSGHRPDDETKEE